MNTIKLKQVFNDSFEMREAFKALRTNIQFCGDSVKTIVITSCESNEGKSSISVEVAKSLSEINKKVLLIDADLRKSVFAGIYTEKRSIRAGLSQYLSGQASLDDVIYTTQYPGLFVIFAGHLLPNPSELLSEERFRQTLENAKTHFDYVIIDSPPLGAVIDSAIIAKHCDGAILVVSEGRISFRFARDVKQQLEKSGCKILGSVLSCTAKSSTKKYYGRYYKKYGTYKRYGYYRHYGHYGNEAAEAGKQKEKAAAK